MLTQWQHHTAQRQLQSVQILKEEVEVDRMIIKIINENTSAASTGSARPPLLAGDESFG